MYRNNLETRFNVQSTPKKNKIHRIISGVLVDIYRTIFHITLRAYNM